MEFIQIFRLLDLLHVHKANFLPVLHLWVLGHSFVDISPDEKTLVDLGHVINDLIDFQGGSQSNQPFNTFSPLLQQISDQVVASEARAHHENTGFRVIQLDAVQSYI